MNGTAGHVPLGAEYGVTKITLVPRPDRRQIPTRRARFRGGRRADDRADEAVAKEGRSSTDGSARAKGSAIVMGWESRPGTLRRAAGTY